jgi:uncharacterized membrane protein YgcG
MKGIAGWTALALAGLVLAAGLGLAARELSSQDVGLSAEPITVGDELAPAAAQPKRKRKAKTRTTERTETTAAPDPAQPRPAAPAPTDDKGGLRPDDNSGKGSSGGGGDSSGKGSGGDD